MKHQQCVAMILAGGQGSRLGALTDLVAKPAVPFGGKYRIIDFPLSNCAHSGIEAVGVLTQYQPLALNAYIGSGQPWDLDRMGGGVFVLPPYRKAACGEWYKGTANAIYQNIAFLEQFTPDYVLVLSGDHIYKMDYAAMLACHKQTGADVTISVLEVDPAEASRFGIMHTAPDGQILEFEEKPAHPKSNLASMGVYLFNWPVLKAALEQDEANPASSNDFGKDVIPAMLAAGRRLYAYAFSGYWKDVGTLQSLWEANMDLLRRPPLFDVDDPAWRIYSRSPIFPPHFAAEGAEASNSLVTEGCTLLGKVSNSIVFPGAYVGAGARVEESILFPGARVEDGAHLVKTIVGTNACVGAGARVGETLSAAGHPLCSGGITLLADGVQLPAGSEVFAEEMIANSKDGRRKREQQ